MSSTAGAEPLFSRSRPSTAVAHSMPGSVYRCTPVVRVCAYVAAWKGLSLPRATLERALWHDRRCAGVALAAHMHATIQQ